MIPQHADGQVLYGSVVGSIGDQSGAVVPGALVTLTNKETGQTREGTSDSQGSFNIVNVLPGSYALKAALAGFRTIAIPNVDVSAGNVVRTDVNMEVGQVSETVNVSATTVQLQTDKASTQTQITTKPIQVLPLSVYRNYQALINLVPGATPAGLQNSATDTPGRSLSTNINGTPRNMNTTRVDGAVNVNIWLPHHNAYVAPSETVAEVNVSTTALDAELGSAGGAAVTVITKSGTNELHGSAWEYHNNQRMKSRPYFMPTSQQKPRDTLNIFGGTLGGPIVKNKLFYFGNYEGTRQRTGGSGIYDVPQTSIRGGDFSNARFPFNSPSAPVTAIYDPRTGNPDGTGRTPFPGNIIPADRISAVSRRVLALLPEANIAAPNQNFAAGGTGIFDRTNYDYKLNYNRNDKHAIFYKSSFLVADVTGVPIFGELIGPAVVQDPGTGHTFTQLHTLGHSYAFSSSLLLDQNIGFIRQNQTVLGNDYGKNWGSDVFGIPGSNGADIRQSGMPNFTFGFSNVGMGATWIPLFRVEQTTTTSTNMSWLKGSHDVRFGFNSVRFNLNHWQPEIGGGPRGTFDFAGGVTALNGTGAATPNLYNQFAAFLLGTPSSISKSLQNIEMKGREWQFDWYIRDRWQVNRKLTLSYGLKYALYPLMNRGKTGLERLDPATNLVYLGGIGNTSRDAGLSINTPGWAPTLGFAYRVKESTVIRAGYGMTWDPLPFSRPLRGWYPLTISGSFVAPNSFSSFGRLEEGVPPVIGPDLSSGVIPLSPTADERSPWGKINRGYIQSWNFTIEHKLPSNIVASVAYVGTQSTNMLADRNINTAGPGTATTDLPYAKLFNRRIATNMWDGWLSSNYHSLQSSLNRQFANGLLLKGAYTWSKAINMADDNGWVGVNWNWEPVIGRNRARAGYDRTHVLQLAYVYELPFGRGKKLLSSGPASWIVGNWSASGLFYAFTGNPFTVGSNAPCNCPGNLQTANQLNPVVEKIGNFGPGQFYYDPKAYEVGPANQFGSSGRNTLTGPGRIGTDLSLARVFPIRERVRFELRGDAFNLTNTPAFNNPTTNASDGNFMQVRGTNALSERQLRVGAVLRF